jgi:hypothetical protein
MRVFAARMTADYAYGLVTELPLLSEANAVDS